MSPTRLITALVMILMLLAGCGRKGDLYHPSRDRSPPPAEQPAEPAQEPAPASTPGD